jgi:hypothetical protein
MPQAENEDFFRKIGALWMPFCNRTELDINEALTNITE